MRKIVGLVFVGLGVALIALAVALPSYVYPRLAKHRRIRTSTWWPRGRGSLC